MKKYKTLNSFIMAMILFGLMGCSFPISKQYRTMVPKDLTFAAVLQNPMQYKGNVVLWGGEILETLNLKGGTEIVVLQMPLDFQEEPHEVKSSEGRFIAKSPKFLDPAIYKKGRKITLAGEISGQDARPLGKSEYAYPVVIIKETHLWEPRHRPYDYAPYYYPFYDPWWPYNGYYYRPYYYGPFWR